jgi:hypothetical protein
MSDRTQLRPGYPIRKPWDHSSVDNSPRHIAASHVLHRPLVPRHPHNCPKTLDHKKMLATTIQISTNHQPPPQPTHLGRAASSNQKPRNQTPHPPPEPQPTDQNPQESTVLVFSEPRQGAKRRPSHVCSPPGPHSPSATPAPDTNSAP